MSDFLAESEQQINEIFSASSVMDVTELRTLYYGRLNLFVTFTDDGTLTMRPDSNEQRPAGYVAYSVPDVIGRKVKSPEFYANVYRVKKNNKSREYIENIKTYTKTIRRMTLSKRRSSENVLMRRSTKRKQYCTVNMDW